jgi:hypothetical protein
VTGVKIIEEKGKAPAVREKDYILKARVEERKMERSVTLRNVKR